MIRITTLLWVALLAVAGGTVMNVSYKVRHVERHIAELQRDMRQEQEAIRILGAEWDTLNDPQRIDGLSKRYLSLAPTPVQRVVTLDDIPMKPSAQALAKLETAQPGKPASARPTDRKPELMTRAGGIPAVDGVGLILARVERHE